MAKKPARRVKHIPQRTCVGCRTVMPKRELIRLVRTSNGVQVDPIGKMAGRGAYLHNHRACWENGLEGALAHALKITLTTEDQQYLEVYMRELPEEPGEIPVNG